MTTQVKSGLIADGAVTNTKILDGAVTTTKITDANITSAKIADGAIATAKIADANVTSAKLASGVAAANLGYTPLNKAGDSLSGNLTFGSGYLATSGDIMAQRTAAPTTGVIFLGNSGSKYLYFDGTQYQMPSANLFVNGVQVPLTASNGLTKSAGDIAMTNIVAAATNVMPGYFSWNTRGQVTSYANCNCAAPATNCAAC